jgi:hypothetical protein
MSAAPGRSQGGGRQTHWQFTWPHFWWLCVQVLQKLWVQPGQALTGAGPVPGRTAASRARRKARAIVRSLKASPFRKSEPLRTQVPDPGESAHPQARAASVAAQMPVSFSMKRVLPCRPPKQKFAVPGTRISPSRRPCGE